MDECSLDITPSIYCGGDGSRRESAVVINADNSLAGVRAEYEYISRIYGPSKLVWVLIGQTLIETYDRYYDGLLIRLENGEEKRIWFDINSLFSR